MQDVTTNRNNYIGGSDVPIILGISSFKKRFELLQEKANIRENLFKGNNYTEYGNVMEEKIRDYISEKTGLEFKEDKKSNGILTSHVDGWNEETKTLLEIKTTSQIKDEFEDYKQYLPQLIFYSSQFDADNMLLAVYERPKNFDETLDESRLKVYKRVTGTDYFKEQENIIYKAIELFLDDLDKLKANPFLTEEELQPTDIVTISSRIESLETELAAHKKQEEELKELKVKMKSAMEERGIKSWETNNGVRFTVVADGKPSTKEVFDEKKFKEENEELYNSYQKEKTTKGRAGYLKITF